MKKFTFVVTVYCMNKRLVHTVDQGRTRGYEISVWSDYAEKAQELVEAIFSPQLYFAIEGITLLDDDGKRKEESIAEFRSNKF